MLNLIINRRGKDSLRIVREILSKTRRGSSFNSRREMLLSRRKLRRRKEPRRSPPDKD
jgi:hypothetical protein